MWYVKAVVYFVVALLLSLCACFVTNITLYLFMQSAGFLAIGNSPYFMAGLAVTETTICTLIVGKLARIVLLNDDDDDEVETESETIDVFRELD